MIINILIRTSFRPSAFARCIKSVKDQTYKNIRIIVSYDNHNALRYIPEDIEKVKVARGEGKYFYDAYCQTLKSMVTEGYFMFLDDDDILSSPDIIEKVIPFLSENTGLIVQLKRGSAVHPQSLDFTTGKIGMPCLFLHHSHKNIADVTVHGAGDYVWIKRVSELLPLRFERIVVVYSFNRGNGRQEKVVR
jgi:glycosyltransferase involved in cell wall biosynthesis